jgi:hypothetical protein
MGSDDNRFPDDGEGPVREVTISEFAIACFAVSNLQFGDFVRATRYTTDAERYGWSFVFAGSLPDDRKREIGSRVADTPWWVPVPHAYWAQPEGPPSTILDRLDHPVVHVSWKGRAWPFHVAKISAGTGRVRVFLITSPEMRGNDSVAFNRHALLASALLFTVARSIAEAAMTTLIRINPRYYKKAASRRERHYMTKYSRAAPH